MHVDKFIDKPRGQWVKDRGERYAAWVLHHFRLPASLHTAWVEFYGQHKLFATYEGKRYRVTGASRLGDVWLSADFDRDCGYELRLDVEKLSAWGAEP